MDTKPFLAADEGTDNFAGFKLRVNDFMKAINKCSSITELDALWFTLAHAHLTRLVCSDIEYTMAAQYLTHAGKARMQREAELHNKEFDNGHTRAQH